jgi:hypothetical protein
VLAEEPPLVVPGIGVSASGGAKDTATMASSWCVWWTRISYREWLRRADSPRTRILRALGKLR